MLPFLKVKKQTGVETVNRKPDVKPEDESSDQSGDEGLHACAQDILRAISDNDYKHLAMALQSAFELMDAAPHDEYDHDSDNSYSDQNEKAGE